MIWQHKATDMTPALNYAVHKNDFQFCFINKSWNIFTTYAYWKWMHNKSLEKKQHKSSINTQWINIDLEKKNG
jgi:hypothetical protein